MTTNSASESIEGCKFALTAPQPMPRGIATPDGKTAFIAGVDDRIQAVNLDTGERLWSTQLGGQPILADQDKVVIAREVSPSVVVLDVVAADKGSKLGSCRIQFPPGIDVTDPARFSLRPCLVDERVVVQWQASDRYAGGAPPPKFIEESFAAESAGTFECDFRDGQVEVTRSVPSESPSAQTSWAYRLGGVWRNTAWTAGEQQAALEMDRSGPEPVLTLSTDGPGNAAQVTPLITGEAVEPTVTPDGRFLFVRRTEPPGEPWDVWEVTTHRQLGRIPREPGSDFPVVLKGRVYYLAPVPGPAGPAYLIRAIEIDSGRTLWEHALGSPAHAEAPPPPKLP